MNKQTKKLVIAAVCIAIGLVLPKLFHLLGPDVSKLLSPLHIPAFFSGLLLGGPWGLLVGVTLAILSSVLTGMPPMFPMAVCMAIELGTYGLVAGLLSKKCHIALALLISIISGRILYCIVFTLITGFTGMNQLLGVILGNFSFGLIAILFQMILIPLVVIRLKKFI